MKTIENISGWDYITQGVDIVNNPSLILSENYSILFANNSFKRKFQLSTKELVDNNFFSAGDKAFNLPLFKKLLKTIIPKNGFFIDLELHHEFPFIGVKIFLVSAKKYKEVIFLTMEDITMTMHVAKTLATLAVSQVDKISKLEKDIKKLKSKLQM